MTRAERTRIFRERTFRAEALREQGLTYREIGEQLGCSVERARQIVRRASRLRIRDERERCTAVFNRIIEEAFGAPFYEPLRMANRQSWDRTYWWEVKRRKQRVSDDLTMCVRLLSAFPEARKRFAR